MHTKVPSILQVPELGKSCLRLESGGIENLLDVLKQYKILGFLSLHLNRLGADYGKRHKIRYVKAAVS